MDSSDQHNDLELKLMDVVLDHYSGQMHKGMDHSEVWRLAEEGSRMMGRILAVYHRGNELSQEIIQQYELETVEKCVPRLTASFDFNGDKAH